MKSSRSDKIFSNQSSIKDYDLDLWISFDKEAKRQEDHIELIASENYASKRILEAQGSLLTNKYAEGYPSKRYYGGCENVDIAENLAIERAKKLFKADYANVQPHSGSSANAAAYLALLEPNDTILGMSLDHGGHLTHGSKVNFSGRNYKSVQYGLHPETHDIDYDEVRSLAKENKPKLIIAGFSAFTGIIDWKKFREIADEVGAYFLVDMAHVSGLVAADLYPSPVPYADVVTSTTHKTLRGPRSGIILAKENSEIEKKLNSAVFPGSQGGPLMHVIAAKALCFKEALEPDFKKYIQQVMTNAKVMAKTIMSNGIDIVSNGTENHIVLVDLRNKNITGKDLEKLLGTVNITVNKNAVPNDPASPFITSGIRIGSPAVTTRGFKEKEIELISLWISEIINDFENIELHNQIRKKCKILQVIFQYIMFRCSVLSAKLKILR
jgi:glycine hydroxymethyltransferase